MRTVNNMSGGEVVDTLLIFESEEEREEYLEERLKKILEDQENELANLKRDYMTNVNLLHGVYARKRSILAKEIGSSVLESDLRSPSPGRASVTF